MTDHELLSISEVAKETGLQSSALRYYEKAGLISSEDRVGGRRHYRQSVLQRLAAIALLQEAQFTIAEIAVLLDEDRRRERWNALSKRKVQEIDKHLERVQTARELLVAARACTCDGLETCELVRQRRGRHRTAVQTLTVRVKEPEVGE